MSHRALLVVLLGSLVAFGPLSIDMYLPAFPMISQVLQVPVSRVEFSLTSFFIGLALGQLIYGPLSDRLGRKVPLYFGLLLYTVVSLGCALAPSIEALIFLRFFQALGACAGIVIARAMVRDLFDLRESAKVYSLLMLVMGIAPILAPLLGGYISTYYSWRAIFWVHAGFGLISFFFTWWLLPETRKPNLSIRLRRTFHVYAGILRSREFLGNAFAGGFAQAGMFAYITGSSFVFIEVFKVSPDRFGWVFGTNALGLIGVSQLNARLVHRVGLEQLLQRAFVLICIFGLGLGLAGGFSLSYWPVAVLLFGYISTLGMTYPNTAAAALSSQGLNAGSASALLGCIQFSIAFLVSIGVSHFHNGTILPMTIAMALCGFVAFSIFFLSLNCSGNGSHKLLYQRR